MSGPASIEGCHAIPRRVRRLCRIAEHEPSQAVAAARSWYARTTDRPLPEQAQAAYSLGYALLRWERFDEANSLLLSAEQHYCDLGNTRFGLHVRRALLYLKLLRGGDAEQAAVWTALAADAAAAGDQPAALRAQLGHMIQLNLQGLSSAAIQLAAQLAALPAQIVPPGDRAWLLRIRAVAYVGLGDLRRRNRI